MLSAFKLVHPRRCAVGHGDVFCLDCGLRCPSVFQVVNHLAVNNEELIRYTEFNPHIYIRISKGGATIFIVCNNSFSVANFPSIPTGSSFRNTIIAHKFNPVNRGNINATIIQLALPVFCPVSGRNRRNISILCNFPSFDRTQARHSNGDRFYENRIHICLIFRMIKDSISIPIEFGTNFRIWHIATSGSHT